MSTPTIGIDFGTTTSSMAWVDPGTGKAEILKNAEGEEKTPSVVYFGADLALVGTPAEQMLEDPEEGRRVVASVKRELANAPTLALPGRRVKAVEVAAAVFAKLKRDAEDLHFQEPVTRAVITCPASFDVMELEAIEAAARLAGFTEVRTLEEPVAAALAYSRAGLGVGRHVLVYDLGGGTFDLALLREEAGGFALALEPKGLRRCGGDDFDQALYDYCDEEAERQWGVPLNSQGRDLRFLRDCRRRKENLSAQDKVLFSSLVGEGRLFRHSLTRELFEGLIGSRIDTTVRLTSELVRTAEAQGFPVETVVLIGGSSRIPLVQRKLKETLPVEPRRWQHQDVAVALGAAYFAQGVWNSKPSTDSVSKPVPRPESKPPLDLRAVLTPQDIHGRSAERVQARQRAVAEALGREVVFRDRLQDGSEGPEMVVIPPGSYLMGAPDSDKDAFAD
jgi:molecular chaperone DnaK (HSP70)